MSIKKKFNKTKFNQTKLIEREETTRRFFNALAFTFQRDNENNVLKKARSEQYAEFLQKYLENGGLITHVYNHEFCSTGFYYTEWNVEVEKGCGAYAKNVIAGKGTFVTRVPGSCGDNDHGADYYIETGKVEGRSRSVRIYKNIARLMAQGGWVFKAGQFSSDIFQKVPSEQTLTVEEIFLLDEMNSYSYRKNKYESDNYEAISKLEDRFNLRL